MLVFKISCPTANNSYRCYRARRSIQQTDQGYFCKRAHSRTKEEATSITTEERSFVNVILRKNWVMLESLSTYSSTAFLHYWSNLFAKINSKPTDDAEKWNSSYSCARVHIYPSSLTLTGNAFIKCPLQSNVSLKIMKQGNCRRSTTM